MTRLSFVSHKKKKKGSTLEALQFSDRIPHRPTNKINKQTYVVLHTNFLMVFDFLKQKNIWNINNLHVILFIKSRNHIHTQKS